MNSLPAFARSQQIGRRLRSAHLTHLTSHLRAVSCAEARNEGARTNSALLPNADVSTDKTKVRFVPLADIRSPESWRTLRQAQHKRCAREGAATPSTSTSTPMDAFTRAQYEWADIRSMTLRRAG